MLADDPAVGLDPFQNGGSMCPVDIDPTFDDLPCIGELAFE
jgi:hypothetical protein